MAGGRRGWKGQKDRGMEGSWVGWDMCTESPKKDYYQWQTAAAAHWGEEGEAAVLMEETVADIVK